MLICDISFIIFFFFLMIRRPPRSTPLYSSAASDVYKRQDEAHRDQPGGWRHCRLPGDVPCAGASVLLKPDSAFAEALSETPRRSGERVKGAVMLTARFRMKGAAIFATVTLALSMTATPTLAAAAAFYVPPPDKGAVKQIKDLVKQGDPSDAALLTAMVTEGHAVWFGSGTPGAVREQVKKTMRLASAQGTVPVLVAYNPVSYTHL